MPMFRLAVHHSLFKSAVDQFSIGFMVRFCFLLKVKLCWDVHFLEGDGNKMVSALLRRHSRLISIRT